MTARTSENVGRGIASSRVWTARWPPPKVRPLACAVNGERRSGVTGARAASPVSGGSYVRHAEGEGAPGAGDALDPEPPTVQLDQALRLCEAETGARLLAPARLGLHELLEDPAARSRSRPWESDPDPAVYKFASVAERRFLNRCRTS